jgi:hypothetical protein
VVVGVPIKEGTIHVANVSIRMRTNNFYKFEGVSLFPSLDHMPHQFLHVLVIIVGTVDFVYLLLDHSQLVVLFGESLPRLIGLCLTHEGLDGGHFFSGFHSLLDFVIVEGGDFPDDDELIGYFLRDGFPEVPEGFEHSKCKQCKE